MKTRQTWWIVDGYSLLHQMMDVTPAEGSLELSRAGLLRLLEELSPAPVERVTVVFDGRGGSLTEDHGAGNIEVVFSPASRTADEIIERMVAGDRDPARITVVTSDRVEANMVSVLGARVLTCAAFLDQLEQNRRFAGKQISRLASRAPGARLGDSFPEHIP